jgi:adenine specific DNA methylase Mod
MAYLVNMAPRLVELRRVLKRTASLWLHCDPTMSHYLKVLLDAIFGAENFRNEVVWQRPGSKGLTTRRLPNNHDVILGYQRSNLAVWRPEVAFVAYDSNDPPAKIAAKYTQREPDGRRYQLTDITNPNPDRPNLTYEFLGVTRVWRWTKERMQATYERRPHCAVGTRSRPSSEALPRRAARPAVLGRLVRHSISGRPEVQSCRLVGTPKRA